MTQHEIVIIASSSLISGAVNKSSDGSTFSIELEDPIQIPQHVANCTVECSEATVWWVIPNISITLDNNKFRFEHLLTPYVITIPDGLYSLSNLNSTLQREIETVSGFTGLISLIADNPTQKVNIQINQLGTQIDFFTTTDTIREIIGFDAQFVPAIVSTGVYNQLGDNVANFNSIDFFLIHSDIVNRGIRLNNKYSQTIAQVLIDVEPGSQIVHRPFNPPRSGSMWLRGAQRKNIKFWLTDQDNNIVDTNGEDYSCRIVIKYTEKIKIEEKI